MSKIFQRDKHANLSVEDKIIVSEEKKTGKLVADVVDKATLTGKKGVEIATDVWMQTVNGSKALAGGIAKGAKELSEFFCTKHHNYSRRCCPSGYRCM